MKLDIDFSGLIKARRSIGAKLAKVNITPARRSAYQSPFEAKLLKEERIILDPKEFVEAVHFPAGIAAIGHQQVTLHLYEPYRVSREDLEKDPAPKPKYHLCDCRTLEEKRRDGKLEDYIALRDGKDILPVRPQNKETGEREKEMQARLLPCKNCLRQLYPDIEVDPEQFNLSEFFEVNKPIFRCLPLYSHKNYPSGDYTEDFSQISREKRAAAGWRCSQCKVNLSQDKNLLHTHHINGRRGDNHSANLKVLCALCHQQQPGHKHIDITRSERARIETLRAKVTAD